MDGIRTHDLLLTSADVLTYSTTKLADGKWPIQILYNSLYLNSQFKFTIADTSNIITHSSTLLTCLLFIALCNSGAPQCNPIKLLFFKAYCAKFPAYREHTGNAQTNPAGTASMPFSLYPLPTVVHLSFVYCCLYDIFKIISNINLKDHLKLIQSLLWFCITMAKVLKLPTFES